MIPPPTIHPDSFISLDNINSELFGNPPKIKEVSFSSHFQASGNGKEKKSVFEDKNETDSQSDSYKDELKKKHKNISHYLELHEFSLEVSKFYEKGAEEGANWS